MDLKTLIKFSEKLGEFSDRYTNICMCDTEDVHFIEDDIIVFRFHTLTGSIYPGGKLEMMKFEDFIEIAKDLDGYFKKLEMECIALSEKEEIKCLGND